MLPAAELYIARPFVASAPEAEILGSAMLVFLENVQAWEIAPLLRRFDLEHIEPDQWYPHQLWLDVMREISKHPNASENFVAVGRRVIDLAPLPAPGSISLPEVIEMANTARQLGIRNGHPQEGVRLGTVNAGSCLVYHNSPNPEDGVYGMLWEIARRYSGAGSNFAVRRLDNPNPTTEPGTLYEIVWGTTGQ